MSIRPIWNDKTKEQNNIGIIENITELKKVQAEKEKTKSRYKLLFENSTDAIMLFEYDLLIECNCKARELFKIQEGRAIQLSEINPEYQPNGEPSLALARKKIEAVLSGKKMIFKWLHRNLEGKLIHTEVSLSKIENDKVGWYQAIVRDITKQVEQQKAIKESEERFRKLFENSRDGIAITSEEGKIKDCNNALANMLGYKKEELINLSYKDITPSDWHLEEINTIRRMKLGQLPITYRKKYIRKDGSAIPIEMTAYKAKLSNESIIWGVVKDLSENERKEKMLGESEKRYRDLYENSPIGRIRTNIKGDILLANKKLVEILGYRNAEEFIRKIKKITSKEFLPDYNRNEALTSLNEIGFSKFDVKFKTANKETGILRILSKATKNENGEIQYIDSTLEDITNEMLLHEELESHRNNLEEIVEARTKEVVKLNHKLVASNKKLQQAISELDNQKRKILSTYQELKDAQNKMLQSEKMASIGVLTAGIAHEINNPINFINSGIMGLEIITADLINAIKEYAELSQQNKSLEVQKMLNALDEKYDVRNSMQNIPRLIRTIRTGVQRTTEIVKGLRTFSRLDNEEKTAADINEIIDSTLVILQNKYKNRVEIIREYSAPVQISCFPGKLGQVFLNIFVNAIHAIKDKGQIRIGTSIDNSKYMFRIEITDTGEGMPRSVQQRIFDPFFTTKNIGEGTGMGLSIVHGIIEDHKGDISVNSKVNQGTTFTINLPM